MAKLVKVSAITDAFTAGLETAGQFAEFLENENGSDNLAKMKDEDYNAAFIKYLDKLSQALNVQWLEELDVHNGITMTKTPFIQIGGGEQRIKRDDAHPITNVNNIFQTIMYNKVAFRDNIYLIYY